GTRQVGGGAEIKRAVISQIAGNEKCVTCLSATRRTLKGSSAVDRNVATRGQRARSRRFVLQYASAIHDHTESDRGRVNGDSAPTCNRCVVGRSWNSAARPCRG